MLRRRTGPVPTIVWAAAATFGCLLSFYSVVVPLNEAPDEPYHIDLVFLLASGAPYPDFDGREVGAAATHLCQRTAASTWACPMENGEPGAGGPQRRARAAAPLRSALPSFDELGGTEALDVPNELPQHPPLYYELLAGVVRLERHLHAGSWSFAREVAMLRLVNVVLVGSLPLLMWWAARRLGMEPAVGSIAALLPLAVPQLLHIGSTVNNDNLLILLGAVLTGLLAGVVRGDRSWTTGALVAVVTGAALLTKPFALVFPPAILFAYAAGRRAHPDSAVDTSAGAGPAHRRIDPGLRRRGRTCGRGRVVVLVQPAAPRLVYPYRGAGPDLARPSTPGFAPDSIGFLMTFTRLLSQRFWGSFGWLTLDMSPVLTQVATLSAVALATTGLVAVPDVPRAPGVAPARRIEVGSLQLATVLVGAFVLWRAWSLYLRSSEMPFVQGRYLFGVVVGPAVLVAIGSRRVAGQWAAVGVGAAAAVLELDALRHILPTYWGQPGDGWWHELLGAVAWSPWPGRLQAVGAALTVCAAAWLAVELWRTTGVHDCRPAAR